MSRRGATEWLFLATVFTVTFAKVHWAIGGDLSLSDVLTALFLIAFVVRRLERHDGRFAKPAAVTFAFFIGFLVVYLLGFFNLGTTERSTSGRRGSSSSCSTSSSSSLRPRSSSGAASASTGSTLGTFFAGIAANALYGVLQLGVALATGGNLDATVLSPLTGGASQINVYGAVSGQSVYRPNALTGDPNHLGIELTIPLLVLLPMYLRLDAKSRWRTPRCCCSRSCSSWSLRRCRAAVCSGWAAGCSCWRFRTAGTSSLVGCCCRSPGSAYCCSQSLLGGGTSSRPCCDRACRRTRGERRPTSPSTTSSRRSCTRIRCSAWD